MLDYWAALPATAQDIVLTLALLAPGVITGALVLRALRPLPLVAAMLRRFALVNALFVVLIALSVGIGVGLLAQERGLRQGSARAAEKFDLIVAAPGSEVTAMLAAVYLQPTDLPLITGPHYAEIAAAAGVAFAAPIAFGDHYKGAPVVGTTTDFVTHLAGPLAEGRVFATETEAVAGAFAPVMVGDTFAPAHGAAIAGSDDADSHSDAAHPDDAGDHTNTADHAKTDHADHTEDHAEGRIKTGDSAHDGDHAEFHAEGHTNTGDPPHDEDHAEFHAEGHTNTGDPAHDEDHAEDHDASYTVTGRMAPTGSPWDRAILVPVEGVWAIHGLANGHLPGDPRIGPPFEPTLMPGTPAVLVKPTGLAQAYALKTLFSRPDLMSFFPGTVLSQLHGLMRDIRSAMSLMAVLTQALVTLSVLIGLMILVRLIARSLALLRAIGAPLRFVFAVVWAYSAALIVTGAALGLALGRVAAGLIAAQITARTDVAVTAALGWPEVHLVAGFVSLTLFAALLPGWLAARRPLLTDLRG